jgi:hypothetical protein
MKYGLVTNPLLNISNFLVVMLMYIFETKNRSKLYNKAEKCIFIGYKYGRKGYKIWNPENKNIVYSWDVSFREVKYVPKQEFLTRKE